jgi:hypothetical protein
VGQGGATQGATEGQAMTYELRRHNTWLPCHGTVTPGRHLHWVLGGVQGVARREGVDWRFPEMRQAAPDSPCIDTSLLVGLSRK